MTAPSVIAAADDAGCHIFAAALKKSDFAERLQSPGGFTIFAPTDTAFEKFSSSALQRLLTGDRARLNRVLGYHCAVGKVASTRFADKRLRAVMLSGGDVIINGRGHLMVNRAHVIKPDLAATNGVVHGIDAVLWPRDQAAAVSPTE